MVDRAASDALLAARARRTLRPDGREVDLVAILSSRALVGPRPDETAGLAREALDRLDRGEVLDDAQRRALQLAIRSLRPFALVRDGRLDALDQDAAAIFPQWDTFSATFAPCIRSVGKIVRNLPDGRRDVATGFLVGTEPDVVLTNHHVVRQLGDGGDVVLPGTASIGFYQEVGTEERGWVEIERVAAVHPELDAALLLLETSDRHGPALPLPAASVALDEGLPLAVVGFPQSDPARMLSITMLDGQWQGRKRGSPGELLRSTPTRIDHDCSTMPGSSGSPVLTLGGDLVGLHAEGNFGARNGAIRIDQLMTFVECGGA